jgi:hypothetical protein
MNANIIFFSNSCEGSKVLLSLLQGEKLIKYFHLICTDNNNKIPSEITVTPTLFIKGIPKPYIAGAAFVWFQQIKQEKIRKMMNQLGNIQKQYLQTDSNLSSASVSTEQVNSEDPPWPGFNKNEMTGISDTFSFITDENILHSHFEVSKLGKDNIFYVGTKENAEKKINAENQVKMTQTLKNEREKQNELLKSKINNFANTLNNKKN